MSFFVKEEEKIFFKSRLHTLFKKKEKKVEKLSLSQPPTEQISKTKNALALPNVLPPPPLEAQHPSPPSRRDPLRGLPDPRLHQRPEVPDQALHRPGGGVPEGADGVPFDLLGDLFCLFCFVSRERERERGRGRGGARGREREREGGREGEKGEKKRVGSQ